MPWSSYPLPLVIIISSLEVTSTRHLRPTIGPNQKNGSGKLNDSCYTAWHEIVWIRVYVPRKYIYAIDLRYLNSYVSLHFRFMSLRCAPSHTHLRQSNSDSNEPNIVGPIVLPSQIKQHCIFHINKLIQYVSLFSIKKIIVLHNLLYSQYTTKALYFTSLESHK